MTIQQIKATIRSKESVTLENVDKSIDSISYKKIAEVKFLGIYYTEIMITVDQKLAEIEQEKYESTEAYPMPWTGDIYDWLEESPASQLNRDQVLPDGCNYLKDIEIEYL